MTTQQRTVEQDFERDTDEPLSTAELAARFRAMADPVAAALLRLKPLVWVLRNGYPESAVAPMYQAVSIFGVYEVHGKGRGYGGSEGSAYAVRPDHKERNCDSIDHGKQLCSDDYRNRVAQLFT